MRLGNQVSYNISSFRNEIHSIVRSDLVDFDIFLDVRSVVFINVINSMSWM